MKIKLFVFFIISELLIISVLGLRIINKKKSILGTVSIHPIPKDSIVFDQVDNLKYFYEPKANSEDHPADWLPFKATYTINEDSLNEKYNYSVEKPEKVFRIITLGDSFTFGVGVNTIENWSERLENLLNNLNCNNITKFEVINLGVGAYDFQYAVERYAKRGVKYKPDLVVWMLIDFNRINEYIIPSNIPVKENQVKNGKYYSGFRQTEDEIIKSLGKKGIVEYQSKSLVKINNYYHNKLIIVYYPWSEYAKRDLINNLFKTRNETFITELPRVIINDPEYRLADGHPNQKGHELIANDLFNYLTKNKVIPCN